VTRVESAKDHDTTGMVVARSADSLTVQLHNEQIQIQILQPVPTLTTNANLHDISLEELSSSLDNKFKVYRQCLKPGESSKTCYPFFHLSIACSSGKLKQETSNGMSWVSIFSGGEIEFKEPLPETKYTNAGLHSFERFIVCLVSPEMNRKDSSSSDDITVTIQMEDASLVSGGTANLCVFLHDQRLAGASAALVASHAIQIPPGEMSTTVTIPLASNWKKTCKQAGKTFEEMIEPSLYVSLDNAFTDATLKYATSHGPCFDLSPGGHGTLVVQPK